LSASNLYKIRLSSGRIVGPINLENVKTLLLRDHVRGDESARVYPAGEWTEIQKIPEIAFLILAKLRGELKKDTPADKIKAGDPLPQNLQGATQIFGSQRTAILQQQTHSAISLELMQPLDLTSQLSEEELESITDRTGMDVPGGKKTEFEDEKTQIRDPNLEPFVPDDYDEDEKTQFTPDNSAVLVRDAELTGEQEMFRRRALAQEATQMLERPYNIEKQKIEQKLEKKRKITPREMVMGIMGVLVIVFALQDLIVDEPPPVQQKKLELIRAKLPVFDGRPPDGEKSRKIYLEGMTQYVTDTVVGYINAAAKLREAATMDPGNVQALAMLASCYLNLIDSSNKDENYFSVISKLIEMSRAKQVDLPETVIADVELFLTTDKSEAALNRVVEYSKLNRRFGLEMFYYLALTYTYRGDLVNAARYLNQIPEKQAFSAKVPYLGGIIAEKGNDLEEALKYYKMALKFNPRHAKSHLKSADMYYRTGRLNEAKVHLDFIVQNPVLLDPKDLARGYYLMSMTVQKEKRYSESLAYIERAVNLDKNNSDYMLELYTLKARGGENLASIRSEARMYYFLGEGEKLVKQGNYHEAMVQFLQARQANEKSPIPLIRLGDMFSYQNDLANARENYRSAAKQAPSNIEVWSKYIHVLIESYEWDEAQEAMNRFRSLPVNQSAIDKAAADMYQKQGRHVEAQAFYRKAMAREKFDSDVYIAYAESLLATKSYDEAPFFFSLARRFDPLNADAIIGTAKCIAAKSGIDSAISMLQDELLKETGNRAQLLAAIAEFQMQKGSWEMAQVNIEQALTANPEYAYPWKLQGQIYLSNEAKFKNALDKALDAFKSYSDRNASDPSGYLERYKIFSRKTEYEKAALELDRIFAIHPKHPHIHYYKGLLYALQENHKLAAEEYYKELKTSPKDVVSMVALGKTLIALNDANTALKYLVQAMQDAPKYAEAKHWAGYANYLLRNYAGALALYRAAAALDSGNPQIYKRLGFLYRDMNDPQAARQAFDRYVALAPDAPDRAEVEKYR